MSKKPSKARQLAEINEELNALPWQPPLRRMVLTQSTRSDSEIRRNRKRIGLPEVEPPPKGMNLETAQQALFEACQLLVQIQDALGTSEQGLALVEVARNAHRAEQEMLTMFRPHGATKRALEKLPALRKRK